MSLELRRILLFLIRSADFGSRSSARGSLRRSVGTTPRHYSRLDYLQLINYERTHYSGSTGDNPRSRFRLPDQRCRNHAAARLDPTFEVSCRQRFVRRFILPTSMDAGLSGCCSEPRASRAAIMAKTSALRGGPDGWMGPLLPQCGPDSMQFCH